MGRIRVALLACCAFVLLALVPVAHAQSPEPRVVGGDTATIDQFPWQVAVVWDQAKVSGNAHQRQFCGGSVLTTSIVLTAAHCVVDGDPDCTPSTCDNPSPVCNSTSDPPPGDGTCKLDPDDVNVVLGVTTLSTATPADEHAIHADVVDADAVSHHPSYTPYTNDVGYLVLAEPVTTGSTIQTIDLAGDDEAAVWAPDVFVDISGWGSTFYGGNTVDTLRAASVPIVSDSTCGSLPNYDDEFDPATMVCAGYLPGGGVDTCQGDSGGPLEAPLEGGGYRLVGITSWGFGCADEDAPGVYTRIAQGTPEAPDLGLRDDVVARIDELELAFGLTDEPIVGTGGQPKDGGPTFPPPSSDGGSGTQAAAIPPTPTFTDPYLKCHKLKQKKKRRRCFRKVRSSLGL